jgi:pimeloyl-ACP methyl ester carboxylesterase
LSDVKEASSYGDWPSDVVSLADALGIERFAVVGWSSGGPYAGSCAALLAGRLTGVAIVNSRHLAQFNFVQRPSAYGELDSDERAEFDLAQRDPFAAAELRPTPAGARRAPFPRADVYLPTPSGSNQDFLNSIHAHRPSYERVELIGVAVTHLPDGRLASGLQLRAHAAQLSAGPRRAGSLRRRSPRRSRRRRRS